MNSEASEVQDHFLQLVSQFLSVLPILLAVYAYSVFSPRINARFTCLITSISIGLEVILRDPSQITRRILQKVLLYTLHKIISNVYPYLVYYNLLSNVS